MLNLFISFFVLISLQAQADVLISVQDQTNEKGWGKSTCQLMHNSMLSMSSQAATCFVIAPDTFSDERVRKLREKNQFHTHLRVFRESNQKIRIDTHQWMQDDDTDFSSASFFIDKKEAHAQKENLALFARNWAAYRETRNHLKADLMLAAIAESKLIKINSEGQVVDTTTHNPISLKKAYQLYTDENERQKKYMKTSLEVAAVLGFGTYLYYKNIGSMREDHDYPELWDGIGKKVTGNAIREDDNHTAANVGHAFAGLIYFQVARNNGFTFIESTLITFASSAAWEFLEYKEVFSLNDQVFTGWTGAVVGEVFYQMSRAIKNKSETFIGRALAAFFNPVGAVNNTVSSWMGDKRRDVRFGDLDTQQWAQFDFTVIAGQQAFENAKSVSYKGVEMKGLVMNIPNWDRTGRNQELLLETPVSEFQFTYTKSQFGAEDFRFVTEAVLAAVYEKNRDHENGYEYLIGVSSGLDWDQKRAAPFSFEESKDKNKDLWARAHVLGSTIKVISLYKGFRLVMDLRVHADYVMVSSYALEQLEQAEGNREGLLASVKKRGYYYGTGWSRDLNLTAEYGGWQIGFNHTTSDVKNSGYNHRFDHLVTKPHDYYDQRTENKMFIRKIFNQSWSIEVAVVKVDRSGQISNLYSKRTTEKRNEVKLSYIW